MIIRDSSIYGSPSASALPIGADVRIGIVRFAKYHDDIDSVVYTVEVQYKGMRYILNCRTIAKFGDVYNYEEMGLRTWDYTSKDPIPRSYSNRVGEMVAVVHINQTPNEGLILGSIRHPAHKCKIKSGVAYASEFNGLETTISDAGAYKIKFQGTPTTVANLKSISGDKKLPEAKYDDKVAGSYFTFDAKGAYEVSDGAEKPQSIKIDKQAKTLTIISGDIAITLKKEDKSVALKSSTLTIETEKSTSIKTQEFAINSSKAVKIKGAKIAIGSGGVELLDSLIKLIDGLGTLVVNSPVGPCSPVQSAPTWSQIEAIKSKLSSIKGSL
jgi:hypothetical protein